MIKFVSALIGSTKVHREHFANSMYMNHIYLHTMAKKKRTSQLILKLRLSPTKDNRSSINKSELPFL